MAIPGERKQLCPLPLWAVTNFQLTVGWLVALVVQVPLALASWALTFSPELQGKLVRGRLVA